jgi:hypothetical protein
VLARIHVGAMLDQQFHQSSMLSRGSGVQRRILHRIRGTRVDHSAFVQQQSGGGFLTEKRSQMQGRPAISRERTDQRAIGGEQLLDLRGFTLDRGGENRKARVRRD